MVNEKRLIYANALIATLEKIATEDETPYFHLDEITQEIFDAPTVDAVEVVHAHWEDGCAVDPKTGRIIYKSIDCSHCNEIFKTDDREYWKSRFKVCPFCGAKMDGGNEDG